MVVKAAALWVLGLLTVVPYGAYYLLFHAERDQYALLITFVLFWIFGYWGVVGPLLGAIKIRRVMRSIEQARSRDELVSALGNEQTRETAIELIASENHIPRFLATRVYRLLVRGLSSSASGQSSGHRADA